MYDSHARSDIIPLKSDIISTKSDVITTKCGHDIGNNGINIHDAEEYCIVSPIITLVNDMSIVTYLCRK